MANRSKLKDRSVAVQLIKRAQQTGYRAILLTVDTPSLGPRLNEFRNNFTLPPGTSFPNPFQEGVEDLKEGDGSRSYVYSIEDVRLAIQHKVHGVIISNHGGRQLDSVPATLDVLQEVAPFARGKIQLAVDGGIRSCSDIFKALALGAQYCFVGRIPIWGLAYKGEEGVDLAIRILLNDFRMTMTLAGCKSVDEITPDYLSVLSTEGILCRL
ncbi:FMN-dependent dehydrogenase-domain-containing protein [Camillea tinctor]|nr:FMN-dependent dehydrogenase-domain-containing protein [Camillea tinctor]